jgi:hypothetical protein
MNKGIGARRHDQTAIGGPRQSRDAALDFLCIAHSDRAQINPEWRRGRLDRGELAEPGLAGLIA